MSEYVIWLEDKRADVVDTDKIYKVSRPAHLQEPIVRCRDCRDYRASDATCHSWQWHNWDAPIDVEPDGFCAWGEKKEGGE